MWITDEQNQATGEYVELLAGMGSGRAVHAETAIAASARLSGSLLLRSFGFDLESAQPGTVLLSNEANEKYPTLANLVLSFLDKSGIQLDSTKFGGAPEQRGSAPQLDVQQSLSLLQGPALEIARRHSLSLEQAAQSAALATAFIVKECSPSIGAETAFNVAVYGFIEGSKTAPPRLAPAAGARTRRPWYTFW